VVGLVLALAVVGVLAYRALSGSTSITVPTGLKGESVSVATQTLLGEQLKVARKDRATNASPADTVIGVSPPEGTTVPPHSTVTLVVAVPVKLETVPNVVGQQLSAAVAALQAVNLQFHGNYVSQWNQPVIPGTVLQQGTPPNTTLPSGSKVTLTLLLATGTFPLPIVTDQLPTTAAQILGQYGLVAGTQTAACSSSTAKNLVSATYPSANTPVTQGQIVNLTISSGACPVRVPDVLQLPTAQAQSAITGAHLQPVLAGCISGPGSTGLVAIQSPTYNTPVQPGSPVTITIGCTGGNSGTTGNVHLKGAGHGTSRRHATRRSHHQRR
jgi:beta-lactam-binding protein with PASTA domain